MTESQELYKTFLGALNEGASINTFKDLFNVVQRSRDQFKPTTASLSSGSIAKRAAGLILTFPVLVSTAIKIENAILISKAIERKCVSLLQILFSAVNLTDYSDTSTLYDYLAKFHTNLDSKDVPTLSLDDFIGAMSAGMREGAINFNLTPQEVAAIMEELHHLNTEAKTFFNERSIQDFNMRIDSWGQLQIQHEAANPYIDLKAADAARKDYDRQQLRRMQTPYSDDGGAAGFFKDQIQSGEVKKANELQPTNMAVSFKVITDGNINTLTGIIGVKAKLYPVESTEILNRIAEKYSDSNWLFKFIRASTGELSFWKDLIFSVDKMKKAGISVAKNSPNAKLFQLLEKRAGRNNARFFRSNDANPITTLVITQDEVEYLKKNKGVNLNNPGSCTTLMNGYNLMGIVITNDAADYADFLFDDDSGQFARYSYKSLERENKDDSDYKKIVNLLHQGGRI